MSITITLQDTSRLLDKLTSNEIQSKIPTAVAGTLNSLAMDARQDLISHEHTDLHLTRKFIPASTQYEAARSAQGLNMQAEVGLLERVKFGVRLQEGGQRNPVKSEYIAVPVGGGKRQKPSTLLRKKGYFIKELNGTLGIWQSAKDGKVSIKYVLEKQTNYGNAPYLDVENITLTTAKTFRFAEKIVESILKKLGLS